MDVTPQTYTRQLTYREALGRLYSNPFPSTRTGALFNAFSYPTKISPEAIAVFLASHTNPGDVVLDTFGGSGTTGLAAHLCSNPSPATIALAQKMGAPVTWGPRKAVIYELGVLGAFVSNTICKPPDAERFYQCSRRLIDLCERELGNPYEVLDDKGMSGCMRYAIYSDVIQCQCGHSMPFWDAMVTSKPLTIAEHFSCPNCGTCSSVGGMSRVTEDFFDNLLGRQALRRKRVIKRIYGVTGKRKWYRDATPDDQDLVDWAYSRVPRGVPIAEIPWGDLYRAGYHSGISHLHHFYSPRNLRVLTYLWNAIDSEQQDLQDALRLLVLSYNSSHATLMSRVVVKSGENDFVVTGAQPGVLYISSLPVEKNLLDGIRRKARTFREAFALVNQSTSSVSVVNSSSTKLDIPDKSVRYVFTDPPFGDFIPYSEVNFINEAWLGRCTDTTEEVVISGAQGKGVADYGLLMTKVFEEISRVLVDNGEATVVFHSATADVWQALQNAYMQAGLRVQSASVLDKLQGSFKQVTSKVFVKGDPLLLLAKGDTEAKPDIGFDSVMQEILQSADIWDSQPTVEMLYAKYVGYTLQGGNPVIMGIAEFAAKHGALLRRNNHGADTNQRS